MIGRWVKWSVLWAWLLAGSCRPSDSPPPAERWPPPRPIWVVSNVDPGWRAAGADTIVFVGSEHRSLIAIDRATGRKTWALEVPDGIVPESLVAVGDQMLFAHGPGITSSVGLADGAERWRLDLGCALIRPVLGAGIVTGNCWPQRERAPAGIVAIDAATGSQRWLLEVEGIIGRPGVDRDTVYLAFADGLGHVVAIDAATGHERWRTMIQDDVTEAAAGDGAVVVLGHRLHGLDAATGRPLWTADRLDDSQPEPDERALVVHRGLVARTRQGAIEGLDPRTGAIRETWRFPAAAGARAPGLEDIWDLGDTLAAHVGGQLVVWRNKRAEVMPLPAGVLRQVAAPLALLTAGEKDFFSTTAVAFGPEQSASSGAIPSVVAPSYERPAACDWDDSIAAVTEADLVVGLPRGPYVRHRDDLFTGRGGGWSLNLVTGAMSSSGIEGAPQRIAVDDEYVYWAEGSEGDWSLVRVARRNAARVRLADGRAAVENVAAAGDHLYWSEKGALHRIARDGGPVETPWRGGRVTAMAFDRGALFFVADGILRSITPGGRAGRPLARGIQDTPLMAFDAAHLYAVARRAHANVILRVPRGGGAVRELFTSEQVPQAIAVNDTRLFIASRNGEILSVALRDGGAPSLVARERPTSPCGETWRLEWAGDSLLWIGGNRPGDEYGSLWSVRP